MKNKLYNIILSIIGLTIFIIFMWYRFIRERLPKDVPFILSLEGLIILIEICLLYLYIVYTLSTEKKHSNAFIISLINNIFKPLEALDHSIKNHPRINPYYKRFIIYLAYKLDPILNSSRIYYYTFAIFPRLVLVTALWIDVFYFHKLFYIYKVLLIGILLFLNRYLIYSLNYAKEHFIAQLEPLVYKPHIPYDHEICAQVYYNGDEEAAEDEYEGDAVTYLELRDLIYYASGSIYYYKKNLRYTVYTNEKYIEIYCKKHNIPFPKDSKNLVSDSVREKISKEVDQKVENILKISVLLLNYELFNEYTPEIKNIKILIFSNYLVCWLFILIVSIPTFSFEFSSLPLYLDNQDPFSGNDIN
jgi:hypothetical protein